jgi:hypothetical protein
MDPDPDPVFLKGIRKGRPSYRRSLQPLKENIQRFKRRNLLTVFYVLGNLLPPGSDPDCESGSGYRSRNPIESGSNLDPDPDTDQDLQHCFAESETKCKHRTLDQRGL